MHLASPTTVTAAEPSPESASFNDSKSSEISSCDSATGAFEGPDGKAALNLIPSFIPLPQSFISIFIVVPRGSSYTPGLFTSPLSVKSIVPGLFEGPIFENHSPPLSIICGIFERVSVLFTNVGFPYNPFAAG